MLRLTSNEWYVVFNILNLITHIFLMFKKKKLSVIKIKSELNPAHILYIFSLVIT